MGEVKKTDLDKYDEELDELAELFGLHDRDWASSDAQIKQAAMSVAPSLARVAELIGEASGDLIDCEASFKHWRAASKAHFFAENRKATEWKASAETESDPAFMLHHGRIAKATERLETLQAFQVALLAKRDLVVAILAA